MKASERARRFRQHERVDGSTFRLRFYRIWNWVGLAFTVAVAVLAWDGEDLVASGLWIAASVLLVLAANWFFRALSTG